MPHRRISRKIGDYIFTVRTLDAVAASELRFRVRRDPRFLDEDDLDYVCDSLSPTTTIEGGEYTVPHDLSLVFAEAFSADYVTMFAWLDFAIEVNYGGLLAAANRERAPRVKPKTIPLDLPPEIDWFIWRLVTAEQMKITLADLSTFMSFEDARRAHLVLDALASANAQAAEEARSR